MKTINFLLKQKLLCALILVILSAGSSAFCEESAYPVTIRGTIANIAEVGEYINDKTHLRLYPCETTDSFQVRKDAAGNLVQSAGPSEQKFYLDEFKRMVPHSGFSGTGLPIFGDFNFLKVQNLEPGRCYKICVMMLDPPYSGMVALTDADGKTFEIIIPEPDAEKPGETREVDLTKTPLHIPGPEKKDK